jgi:hypothetical protein
MSSARTFDEVLDRQMRCFAPTVPAVYNFGFGFLGNRSDLPKWMNWGWCDATELASLIQTWFGQEWDRYELLERFGIEKGVESSAPYKGGFRLLFVPSNGDPRCVEYNQGLLARLQRMDRVTFYVPAGFAKQVVWDVNGGVDRYVIRKGKVVASSNGEPTYFI